MDKITLMLANDGVRMEIRAGDVAHGSGMVVRLDLSPSEARSLASRLGAAADSLQAGILPESERSIHPPTGRLMIHLIGAIGEWERSTIGERTAAALAEVKAQGRAAGTPTFGFRKRPDGYLEPDADEQAVLTWVTQLRAAGESWRAVVETLTTEGHQTRNGSPFSASGLHAIWRRREVAA